MLSLMQKDMLTEVFTIYMGRVATALSELLTDRVKLQVSETAFLTAQQWEQYAARCEAAAKLEYGMMAQFSGGSIFVCFPPGAARCLAEACLKQNGLQDVPSPAYLTDIEVDVVREWSNLLLNGAVQGLNALLDKPLQCSIPEPYGQVLFGEDNSIQNRLLVIEVNYWIAEQELEGSMTVIFCLPSDAALSEKLNEILTDKGGSNAYVAE